MKINYILLAICIAFICTPSLAENLALTINSTLIYSGTLENWGVSGIQLPNGSYVASWDHASVEGTNTGVSYTAISSDYGATWSSPYIIVTNASYQTKEIQWGIFNGSVYYFYQVINQPSSNPSDGYVIKMASDGNSWGAPIQTFHSTTTPVWQTQNPIQLKSGRILLPGYITNGSKYDGLVWYSDDNCSTWHNGGLMIGVNTAAEPSLVQFPNQTIIAILRDETAGLHQYKSFSTDNGITWTVPVVTSIQSPKAMALSMNTANGNYALLWNNVSSSGGTPRYPLTFGISTTSPDSITKWTDIQTTAYSWSNFGMFTNTSGKIIVVYDDETNWKIYTATLKESDFITVIKHLYRNISFQQLGTTYLVDISTQYYEV